MVLLVRSAFLTLIITLTSLHLNAQVFGEVLYSWDFSTGLPAGWTNTSASNIGLWEYRGPNTTPSSNIGPRGTCSSGALPIQSLTRENGFMIFDSNFWDDAVAGCGGLGTGSDPAPHTAWLTTGVLNFSTVDAVVITFQEQYRLFSATCKVQVSVNNGAWQDAGTNSGLTSNNAIWTTYNISSFAAFQSNVRLRFQFQGTYYWWQIDDVAIYSPNDNDLRVLSSGYTVNPTPDNLYNELEYDQYPSTMLAPLRFRAGIRNIGANSQTGVTMTSRVINSANTVVNNQTTPAQNIPSAQTVSFQSTNTYTPPATSNEYTVEIIANTNASTVDQNLTDNIATHDFSVTPYTYARDEGPAENFFAPAAVYANEPMEIGNVFEGRNAARSCRSLQVALGEGTEVGSQIQAIVYNEEYDQVRAVSAPYTVNLWDINQLGEEKIVTLQLTTPVVMHPDTFYIAMVRNLDGNAPLRVCRSGEAPSSTAFVNYYNLNALFFLLTTPVVRMNIFPNNQTPGCMDATAMNFNPAANVSDGSCRYPGCTISYAINYDPDANFYDDSCIVPGCTDPEAFNFDPLANVDDGSCINGGCTNPDATNFDPGAEVDDGTCIVPGCTIPEATNYNPEATEDDGSCVVPGCTNPVAANYNPNATEDDGTCVIAGCTNPAAVNYNPNATLDNGTCVILGCLDPLASNYNPNANQSNNSCIYLGCTNPVAENYNPQANQDDGSCIILGCTNEAANNYDPAATEDDGSCQIEGCTDPVADNYNSEANIEDGSCIYIGCTDEQAINFDPTALEDDGTCLYPGCIDETAVNFDPTANVDDGSCIFSTPALSVNLLQGCAPLTVQVTNQTAVVENSICQFYIDDDLVYEGCESTFNITIPNSGTFQIEYRYTIEDAIQSAFSAPIIVNTTPPTPVLTYDANANQVVCSTCNSANYSWAIDGQSQSEQSSTISTTNNGITNNGSYVLTATNAQCASVSEPLMVLQPSLTFNLNDQCAPSVIQIVNNTDIPQGAVMLVNYGIGNSVILNPGTNFFNYLQAGSYEIEVSLSFNTSLVEVTQPFIVSAAITPQLQWLADQDLVSCLNCEDTGETSWLVDGVAAGTGTSISDNLGIVYSANFTNEFGCIGTAAIVISNVVEIDESQLKLYPNPSSGDFRIESDQPIERLEIVNSLGQKVVEQNGLNITSTIISLPIQGTYMVRALVAGDWVETRVLVVR